jgi:hypothetical protein
MFVLSFLMNAVSALVAAAMLAQARQTLRAYWQRVLFVAALGLFVGAMVHGPYWNWMHFPADVSLVMFADHLVGCLLAGLAIAAIVKAPAQAL